MQNALDPPTGSLGNRGALPSLLNDLAHAAGPSPGTQEESAQKTASAVQLKQPSERQCQHCRSRELKKLPYDWRAWILARGVYKCSRCNKRTEVWALTWRLILALILVGAFAYTANYYRERPFPWVSAQAIGVPVNGVQQGGSRTLSRLEEMIIRRPKTPLTNQNILDMTRAKVGTEVIVRLVRTSTSDYDLSAPAIIGLTNEGVAQAVILAMIDTSILER